MADAGDLEKLPPEIRNEIYALVLVQAEPVVLCNFGGDQRNIEFKDSDNKWALSDKAKVAPLGHNRRSKYIGYQYAYGTRRLVEVLSDFTLLRVNKKIYAEAAPVLYGCTKFRFVSSGTMRRFLNLIGDNKQHLRDVGMCGGGWKFRIGLYEARYAMEALAAAKSIRIFEVSHLDVCPKVPAASRRYIPGCHKVVRLCRPFLNSLKIAYKDNDLNASIEKVIQIRTDEQCGDQIRLPRRIDGCGCTKNQMDEANEGLLRKIKQIVAEQHNLDLV